MKKNKIHLLIILLFGITLNNFGQNSVISKDEYDVALAESNSKTDNLARRETSVNLRYSNGKIIETYTNIREYLPPDKSRWTNMIEKQNSSAERNESITIGDKIYNKKNRGNWELENKVPKTVSTLRNSVTTRPLNTVNCWQYMKFSAEMNEQPATQYFSYSVSQIQGVLYFFEDRKWINADGLMLKSTIKVSSMVPENITSTTTVIYDYNPKDLIIEAPVINK